MSTEIEMVTVGSAYSAVWFLSTQYKNKQLTNKTTSQTNKQTKLKTTCNLKECLQV